MNNRRSFFKQLAMGVSVLGSAGIFLPRAVDAYRWRRGLVEPVYGYKFVEKPLRFRFDSRELAGEWCFDQTEMTAESAKANMEMVMREIREELILGRWTNPNYS